LLRCAQATRLWCPSWIVSLGQCPTRPIGDSLAARDVRLSLGGSVYDPNDPMDKCFFNILATFAEFEVDLLRMRTREGMAIARANGRLKGKTPQLSRTQRAVLVKLHAAGDHTIAEVAELFSISRATVYREIARATTRSIPATRPVAFAEPWARATGRFPCVAESVYERRQVRGRSKLRSSDDWRGCGSSEVIVPRQ
jgi:hypothetical protein